MSKSLSKSIEKNKADSVTDRVAQRYAVGITDHVRSTIKGPVETDPVAKQYIPQLRELQVLPEENPDPIGDFSHTPVKGLVHRYEDRVLLKLANVCAVYCRYCFRRDMIGPGSGVMTKEERSVAYEYIRSNPDIREVILTGGDPLVLSARQLDDVMEELCAIPHVDIIRIHTRVPLADPRRITDKLCMALDREKPVYIALHINHAQEITPDVEATLKNLHKAGCVLLSQSVLLKGVNDDATILEDLYRKLLKLRVKPYYLHHPDMAPGTAHFRLSIQEGQRIVQDLHRRATGLALPHYMLDIPGGYGKVPINPDYLEALKDGTYMIEDMHGVTHHYPPEGKDHD